MMGRAFIVAGTVLVIIGIALLVSPKVPWLGRLPGDVFIQKKNFSLYFPITTCILVSMVITFIFFLLGRR
jgi:hypothetical protein